MASDDKGLDLELGLRREWRKSLGFRQLQPTSTATVLRRSLLRLLLPFDIAVVRESERERERLGKVFGTRERMKGRARVCVHK